MMHTAPGRMLSDALTWLIGGPASPLTLRSSRLGPLLALVCSFVVGLWFLDRTAGVVAILGLVLGLGLVRLAPRDRRFLLGLFLAGFGSRLLAAVIVYHGAPLFGVSRFIFPDSWAYDWIAARIADSWRGVPIPDYGLYEYLVTHFTELIAAVYWALGPSAIAALVLNCTFAALSAVLIAMTTARLFDERAARVAGVIASFFPSAFFWSILLLKDAFYAFLVAMCVWAFTELVTTRRLLWLVPLAVAWWSLTDVRNFAFYFLGVLIPIAFFIGVGQPLRARLALSGLMALVIVPLMVHFGAGRMVQYYLLGDTAAVLEYHRTANAVSADTAFVPLPTPRPTAAISAVQVLAARTAAAQSVEDEESHEPPAPGTTPAVPPDDRPGWRWTSEGGWLNDLTGEQFVDGTLVSPSDPQPAPDSESYLPPDDRLAWRSLSVVEDTGRGLGAESPLTAAFPDGGAEPTEAGAATPDRSVADTKAAPALMAAAVPAADASASATAATQPTPIQSANPDGKLLPAGADRQQLAHPESGLGRMLEYLPIGLWYTLTAPLPWNTPKLALKLTIPDMLLWYILAATAFIGLVVARSRWRLLILPVGYLASIAILLALLEGNVGTLFRHRAMLIPFTAMLSAAGLVWLWDRYRLHREIRVRCLRQPGAPA